MNGKNFKQTYYKQEFILQIKTNNRSLLFFLFKNKQNKFIDKHLKIEKYKI